MTRKILTELHRLVCLAPVSSLIQVFLYKASRQILMLSNLKLWCILVSLDVVEFFAFKVRMNIIRNKINYPQLERSG